MDSATTLSFVRKLLEQTESKKVKWEPILNKFHHSPIQDTAYSYITNIQQGEIVLGKPSYNSSEIYIFITPESGPTYNLSDFVRWRDSEAINKYKACIKKLYNYVYQSNPNVDSFMDDFLKE